MIITVIQLKWNIVIVKYQHFNVKQGEKNHISGNPEFWNWRCRIDESFN